MISFEIEGIPVPKGRSRSTRSGHHYTPAKTRAYEQLVASRAREAMQLLAPLEGPLRVTITFLLPIPASWSNAKRDRAIGGLIKHTVKPDLSNLAKSIEDGMNGIVYRDDSQIIGLSLGKRYSHTPVVWVEVTKLG